MKKLKRSTVVTVCLFIAMNALTIGLGYYRESVMGERASFMVSLPSQDNKPVMLDLAEQGFPKHLFQPGKVSISSDHREGITNKGEKPLPLQVVTKGFPGKVTLHSNTSEFDEKTGQLGRPLESNQSFSLSLDLEIPDKLRQQYHIFSGLIQFIDPKSGNLLGVVPVHVVNSQIPVSAGDSDIKNGSGYDF